MALPTYIYDHKERYMADETSESEELTNREKYALLKEFHRTLRQVLTGAEYKVFCAIEDWSESKGECWHSQSTIADACDISLRSVNASIKQLETLALVETKDRVGQSSLYVPVKPTYAKIADLRTNLRKNCTGGYAKSAHPPTQNLRINVSNINGSNNNELTTPNGVAAPPQKSATIDLNDTGYYQENQPEPEPQQEQLPVSSSRQAEAHDTYPAPSTPPATQKVKGDSGAGVGVEGKSKGKGQARDKPPLHPALGVFQNEFKLLPPKRQHQGIIDTVGDTPDVLFEWGKACHKWNFKGYSPTNLDGLINFFQEGNYKNEFRAGNGRGRGERATGEDRAHPAFTGPKPVKDPQPSVWDREDAAEIIRGGWHL